MPPALRFVHSAGSRLHGKARVSRRVEPQVPLGSRTSFTKLQGNLSWEMGSSRNVSIDSQARVPSSEFLRLRFLPERRQQCRNRVHVSSASAAAQNSRAVAVPLHFVVRRCWLSPHSKPTPGGASQLFLGRLILGNELLDGPHVGDLGAEAIEKGVLLEVHQ